MQTAGSGVDRMNDAASTAHEHRAVDDRRRRERRDVAVEAECPLQLQASHVGSGDPTRILESRVR